MSTPKSEVRCQEGLADSEWAETSQWLFLSIWENPPGYLGPERGGWEEGREGVTCRSSSRQPQSVCSSALASVTGRCGPP